MSEQWRAVVGYEGSYEVSSLGRVRNIAGRVLTGKKRSSYLAVELYRGGRGKFFSIHHLVLEAFHEPRPQGMIGLHNNGQYYDNRASNLRWGTYKDNTADMIRHGNGPNRKNGHYKARLKPDDIERIRKDHRVSRLVAAEYGVCSSLIRNIRCGIAK